MLGIPEETVEAPGWHQLLELRTTVVAAGREFLQIQILSPGFVLTRIGRGAVLFLRAEGRRYTADREARVLRPIEAGAARSAQVSSPRPTITRVSLHDGPVVVDGHACRRLTIESRVGQVALSTESYFARVAGVDRTALHAERLLTAPEAFPSQLLQPDEVLIRATTVVRQGDFEQVQTSCLCSMRADPDAHEAGVEVLGYRRADATA
jgi:hypothetical protein